MVGMLRKKGGLTLVELMIVVIIIGLLTAVGLPLYSGYVTDAKVASAKQVIGSIASAEKLYHQRKGAFVNLDTTTFEGAPASNPLGIDVRDATQFWTLSVEGAGANKFEVIATGKAGTDYDNLEVKLEYFIDQDDEWKIL